MISPLLLCYSFLYILRPACRFQGECARADIDHIIILCWMIYRGQEPFYAFDFHVKAEWMRYLL